MCDFSELYFGVEIELIASPRFLYLPHTRAVYYQQLAQALKQRRLRAAADSLVSYCKHPEHYDKWWITKDGSLGKPEYPRIALEAVSPIMRSDYTWEREIDTFWGAWSDGFQKPDSSIKCGAHIHVSPYPDKRFGLPQLQDIAYGVIYYEPLIGCILPYHRRQNPFCRPNTMRSRQLENIVIQGWNETTMLQIFWQSVYGTNSKQGLRDLMQSGFHARRVLWNFDHVVSGGSGTVEFRGGPGLRDTVQTKRWVSFVLAFVHLCLTKVS
ncbi:hypothetical protein CTRI78_v006382 [Colletotrichum trifolii]|uniref:Swim zinc finger domain protein n=1 Tax=Colletotrichum trifolii TaxID=5466 RepID=A0A4R8RCH5_COLTR|nr:hypothetical protein CTRI78_v006382 [Colletotrichum trifolii]